MKYLLLIGFLFLVGCGTQRKAYPPNEIIYAENSKVFKIDTLPNRQCLYSTMNSSGIGSIITRCGCFMKDEDVNHECISQ